MTLGMIRRVAGFNTFTGSAAYAGPGDLLSFDHWWGLRAYSAATTASNLANIVRASDSGTSDFAAGANGVLASPASFLSATTGKFVTLYDIPGSADFTQGTDSARAPVNLTGHGSFVTAAPAATGHYAAAASPGITAPYTMYFIAKRTTGTGYQTIFQDSGGVFFGYNNAANQVRVIAGGTEILQTASDTNMHVVMAVINGASSKLIVDGSTATGNPGTTQLDSDYRLFAFSGGSILDGHWLEFGVIAGDQSASESTLRAQATAFWGL